MPRTIIVQTGNDSGAPPLFHVGHNFLGFWNKPLKPGHLKPYLGVVGNIFYNEYGELQYRCIFVVDGDIHDFTEEQLVILSNMNYSKKYMRRVIKQQVRNVRVGDRLRVYNRENDSWQYGTVQNIRNKRKHQVMIAFGDEKRECVLSELGVDFSYKEENDNDAVHQPGKRQKKSQDSVVVSSCGGDDSGDVDQSVTTNESGKSFSFWVWMKQLTCLTIF